MARPGPPPRNICVTTAAGAELGPVEIHLAAIQPNGVRCQVGLEPRDAAVQVVFVRSLDFRGDMFQGPREILTEPALWPRRIIVMTLGRVGSGAGPDVARLAEIRAIASGCEIYAAGGVRDAADLSALKAARASGALIATALHERRIVRADLEAI